MAEESPQCHAGGICWKFTLWNLPKESWSQAGVSSEALYHEMTRGGCWGSCWCCVLLATALRSWVWEKPGEHLFSKHAGPRELNPFPFAVFLQHPLLTKLSIFPPADRGKPLKSPSPLLWAIKAKQARKAEFGPMRHNVATGICPKLCLSTESPSLMVQFKRCLLSTAFLTIIASFTKHN